MLQETYKRALAAKRKPVAADADELRPWIFTIMRHVWQNEIRRISRAREVVFEEAPVVSGEYTEFGMTRKLLVSEVRAAVEAQRKTLAKMVAVQEDLDWYVYFLFELVECGESLAPCMVGERPCDMTFGESRGQTENIDTGKPFTNRASRRELLKTLWPRLCGLDLYATAIK